MTDRDERAAPRGLRLPNELWLVILYDLIDDAEALRSAALSCRQVLQIVTQEKRLELAALVGQPQFRLAALNIAALKIDKKDRRALNRLLQKYLGDDKPLGDNVLPTADEVRPLHRAVCFFTDAFFREALWALPRNLAPAFLCKPTTTELWRVRHAFYLQEFIMHFLDGKDLQGLTDPARFPGMTPPGYFRRTFRYPELEVFHSLDFIIAAVLLHFVCGALDQSE